MRLHASVAPRTSIEGEAIGVTDAPVVGASSVTVPLADDIPAAVTVVIAPSSIAVATVPSPSVVPAIIGDVRAPAAQHVEVVVTVAQVPMVSEEVIGFAEVGALSVNLSALAVGYTWLWWSRFMSRG